MMRSIPLGCSVKGRAVMIRQDHLHTDTPALQEKNLCSFVGVLSWQAGDKPPDLEKCMKQADAACLSFATACESLKLLKMSRIV